MSSISSDVASTLPSAEAFALPLEPTARTTVTRGRNRVVADRAKLLDLLADGLMAHVGVDGGDHPVVLPCAYAVAVDGPDEGGTLYLHGSVAAGWIRRLLADPARATVCVTVTELDGLVTARSPFHHSMNYRSAVVVGRAREVVDPDERRHALDLVVDHMVPGRSATLRPSTRKELAATAVLAVPLAEASMKERAGGPVDDEADVATGTWGGHIPLRRVADAPLPDPDASGAVPQDVAARAAGLADRAVRATAR
ncbi:pyridoxamine 5'-phosphate oxidase family protein [Nocardioides jishulii]|uniref:Pyridoxamine 5'-phosphate oxidase family protein n=1 Tax=Nocardioides jishulii TaxID=2575440 RepID=A0A4U2YJW0_9ACTN|nr:pyridoxamine 5'-phosphate oxidase family protein [Nocardioides jishulii]QCX26926.1 pyridoxamine 5'-phosphate oxidase family protein [Nocardioides jishulii]TKI61409.1 pyridoxamine 5'-phosphate oxidase family protein [Nocardioides jishulii]